MKFRWLFVIIFMIGLMTSTILIHEAVHWIQYWGEEDMFIEIFPQPGLHAPNGFESRGEEVRKFEEVEAHLFGYTFFFIVAIYAYNRREVFWK